MTRIIFVFSDLYMAEYHAAKTIKEKLATMVQKVGSHGDQDDDNPNRNAIRKKSSILFRSQLDELYIYEPWFIVAVTCLQLIAVAVLLGLGGITHVGLVPHTTIESKLT